MSKLTGLTSAEVSERRRAHLTNAVHHKSSKSVKDIIISNIFTYFNLIFAVMAGLLILIGSFRDLTFLPIVIANSLIGIIQELRAKKVLDQIRVVHAPRATVLRNGKQQTISTDRLVLDDVIILKAGDQIPADAVVLQGEAAVNESLLTGESDEIPKTANDKLLSGSFIVHGELYAKLTKVGRNSYAAQLTARAKAIKLGEQSEIIGSLNKVVKAAGIVIIPLGLIMFVEQFVFGDSTFNTSIQRMVAALIGMIPEGLFLLASVTLVLSTMRLARREVMLHDMKSIETLARVDTLCVDKTGTITTDEMRVIQTIISQDGAKVKSTSVTAASTSSRSRSIDAAPDRDEASPIHELIAQTVAAQKPDSATMVALQSYYKPKHKVKAAKVQGFSSQYKYSGTQFAAGALTNIAGELAPASASTAKPAPTAFIIGAPEVLLKKSELKPIKKYAAAGYRTLVFAEYQGDFHPDGHLDGAVIPLAFIILENQIRPTAAETFDYFTDQGVNIKVISGDSPQTVSEVAKKAHIPHAEQFIDVSTLKTDQDLAKAAREFTVFGRVTPAQKRQLVQALKKQGHTVAMTGDGVNDVLALKDADCSIAMASGAQAAIQSAQVVLLDSDFAKMPAVVLEGRRVVNNLQRSGSLFLVKNIFSFTTAVLSILLGIVYPLVPTQVSLVTMWTIGVPSFLLAQIPNRRLIRGSFLKNIIRAALPAALTGVALVAFSNAACHIFGVRTDYISTVCAMTWAAVGIMNLYRICFLTEHSANRFEQQIKIGIFALCIVGMISCFVFLPRLFAIEMGGIAGWVIFGVATVLVIPLIAGFDKLLARWKLTRRLFNT